MRLVQDAVLPLCPADNTQQQHTVISNAVNVTIKLLCPTRTSNSLNILSQHTSVRQFGVKINGKWLTTEALAKTGDSGVDHLVH